MFYIKTAETNYKQHNHRENKHSFWVSRCHEILSVTKSLTLEWSWLHVLHCHQWTGYLKSWICLFFEHLIRTNKNHDWKCDFFKNCVFYQPFISSIMNFNFALPHLIDNTSILWIFPSKMEKTDWWSNKDFRRGQMMMYKNNKQSLALAT